MSTPSGMDEKAVIRGVELRLDTLIDGLEHSLPAGITTVAVGGESFEMAALVEHVHELVKPWKDVRAAQAVIRAAMQERAQDIAKALDFLANAKAALMAVFGRTSQDLVHFGFKPHEARRKLTPEEKILRAVKARLTRAKRHTMGRRQKAELKETGTPTVVLSADGVTVVPPAGEPGSPAMPASVAPATPAVPKSVA